MKLAPVEEAAKAYFSADISPAHDWHHIERVAAIADRLCTEYETADGFVINAAVFLHDIGREMEDNGEIQNHAAWGAQEAAAILQEQGVASDRIEAVTHAIRSHRYSEPPKPVSLEAKILSDADNLDALGAVGIARCFTYGGERGSPIHDPDLPPAADETSSGSTQFNHFYKKLRDLPDRMYTKRGREIAEERWEFMEQYLNRFDAEITAEK